MVVSVALHIIDGVFSQEEIILWSGNTIGSKHCPLTYLNEDSTKEDVRTAFSRCKDLADSVDRLSLYNRWGRDRVNTLVERCCRRNGGARQ